jgi:alanine racemase
VNDGDEVVIIGKMGKLEVPADELAEKIGTINYEVISRINPILPRIIV